MTDTVSELTNEQNARQQALLAWVTAALKAAGQPAGGVVLNPLSGDAGFRRYFRIANSSPALLAVDASPQTENNQAFCHIAQLLRQYGIHTPQVYAVDYTRGFLLIEDMGSDMYWPLLQGEQYTDLYRDAAGCLIKMHRIPLAGAGLAIYDGTKLQQEMDLFPQWFVKELLGVEITATVAEQLQKISESLIHSALEQPRVVVHRDYHCRNLMFVTNNNPGVIDFQDAVIGPITYDLVSLYRDCYIHWPLVQVTEWVLAYRQQLVDNKILEDITEEKFLRWFDLMGLQRHIKVLGIFARLYLRDHKAGYLKDLPLVIHYTLSVAKQYPEFADFVNWFERELLPKAKQCDWYGEINPEAKR